MIDYKWDADEKAKDIRTYETEEDSLEALNHILKNIFYSKIRK